VIVCDVFNDIFAEHALEYEPALATAMRGVLGNVKPERPDTPPL